MIFCEDSNAVDILQPVMAKALEVLELPNCFEVELVVCDEEEIKQCNLENRGIDSVTDVLSFPASQFTFPFDKKDTKYCVDPQSDLVILGEIMICEQRVKEQAVEYCHSEKRELCYLFLHGLLHLLGFDHMQDSDKVLMRSREEEILNALEITRD